MPEDLHLKVFTNRSELIRPDGRREIFYEGALSKAAVSRYQKINKALNDRFLIKQIERCLHAPETLLLDRLSEEHTQLLDELVDSLTSEVGRALIGLTILQLCVKSIEVTQSIRLHKGGISKSDFSWVDGIPMRSLDKKYITPTLRHFDLLRLNSDGFMMTRSLAENYPYSPLYKANMRGGRSQWMSIVEAVEERRMSAEPALQYLLSKLINSATQFKLLADETIKASDALFTKVGRVNRGVVADIIKSHMDASNYAARIMEISMHSLMQAMAETGSVGDLSLKPLSQMRSANKKHGNIGDIELLDEGDIVESWDAKYGKAYLREELEELHEKMSNHRRIAVAGFVTTSLTERKQELASRIKELEDYHGITLEILTLDQWIEKQFGRAAKAGVPEKSLAEAWLRAYVESIAQRRADIAPIDEPCYQWLESLKMVIESK